MDSRVLLLVLALTLCSGGLQLPCSDRFTKESCLEDCTCGWCQRDLTVLRDLPYTVRPAFCASTDFCTPFGGRYTDKDSTRKCREREMQLHEDLGIEKGFRVGILTGVLGCFLLFALLALCTQQ